MSYTVGSLFTGVGMFDLGMVAAGFTIKFQAEYDEFCQEVLHARSNLFGYPAVFGDVRDVGIGRQHDPGYADILIGGFPCQPFSIAGSRKGAADHRNMWPEFARIIGNVRPRAVVLENVPTICNPITTPDGITHPAYALTVVADLAARGYDARWDIIRAADAGASHSRARWWLVAYANGARRKGQERQQSEVAQFAELYSGPNKSRLGRNTDGSAYRVDKPRHPALLGREQYDYEPPRTTHHKRFRRDRIKALGNGLSPQIAYLLGLGVMQKLMAEDCE